MKSTTKLYKLSKTSISLNKYGFCSIRRSSTATNLRNEVVSPDWESWKHNQNDATFWRSHHNQRKFFDWLGKQLGVTQLDDWYSKLNAKVVAQHGGKFLHLYNGSPTLALKTCYPEHKWIPWKFKSSTRGFWNSLQQQKDFFEWLGKELGVKNLDDWYSKLSTKTVLQYGGNFLSFYKGSAIEALKACYPEHNWIPWKFAITKRGFWKSRTNQRLFFDWLGKELGVKQPDDWYRRLSLEKLIQYGGAGILTYYSTEHSPVAVSLAACYPEHPWDLSKFENCILPKNYWDSKENLDMLLSDLSQKLQIETMDDWYRVSKAQLRQFGVVHVFQKHGGLAKVLQEMYPDHEWNLARFHSNKKSQRWLVVTLKKLLPDEEILEDYQHPDIKFPQTQRAVQLDVFVPSRSLAFEYQGEQHYQDVGIFQPSRMYQEQDQQKRTLCLQHGITLVEVPYWWDRTLKGLEDIIQSKTPAIHNK